MKQKFIEGMLAETKDFIKPSVFWKHSIELVNEFSTHVRWNAWQGNHFLWVQDVLHSQQVVHTEWGDAKRWNALGANDANNTYVLTPHAPKFFFSDKFGMRWEIINALLEDFQLEELRVVEVGVFAGHFSKFLMEKFPKLQLIGIDPYIGGDETFPGDFSQTLDPNVAYSNAQGIYDQFEGRGVLWPTTSAQAVKNIPDGASISFLSTAATSTSAWRKI